VVRQVDQEELQRIHLRHGAAVVRRAHQGVRVEPRQVDARST
jgi:hypothetical protein